MYINHILSVCADSADILNHSLKIETVRFAYIYLDAHTSTYQIFFTFYQTVKKMLKSYFVYGVTNVNALVVIYLSDIYISIWTYTH